MRSTSLVGNDLIQKRDKLTRSFFVAGDVCLSTNGMYPRRVTGIISRGSHSVSDWDIIQTTVSRGREAECWDKERETNDNRGGANGLVINRLGEKRISHNCVGRCPMPRLPRLY
ncbi:hypothetical protein AG1IA_10211 [Rhizoctonia solani AG-1 IA]|uniref:Uncharacterized protein n=1 Tax=Thanatephorus cucumeris (strain AG1-IA) TaxID=983506 RepID=L8WHB3_THACA|nr:hypothetical protein AG1IA_10211 [Rhizoctonia solani AG-1 IA]